MKIRSMSAVIALLALVLSVSIVASAGAATPSFPAVSVAGAIGFDNNGNPALATFYARAIGPAAPGEEHQPATGYLFYRDGSGLTFVVSVAHIHAHSVSEVHFGGTIARSSDSSLVGEFAHCVAVDGGAVGGAGDLFSILVTSTDTHEHGAPAPVQFGNLVVKVPAM
jgi:hypothetical protein